MSRGWAKQHSPQRVPTEGPGAGSPFISFQRIQHHTKPEETSIILLLVELRPRLQTVCIAAREEKPAQSSLLLIAAYKKILTTSPVKSSHTSTLQQAFDALASG